MCNAIYLHYNNNNNIFLYSIHKHTSIIYSQVMMEKCYLLLNRNNLLLFNLSKCGFLHIMPEAESPELIFAGGT